MLGKLVERDGALHVHYSYAQDDVRELVNIFWRVEQIKGNAYNGNRPSAGDTCNSVPNDWWSCYREGRGPTGEVYFPGNMRGVLEVTPIAPPKVRKGIEIRYANGRWEKCSKAKGWIHA